MRINGKEILGKEFAFDGCHKIYIIEDDDDKKMAIEYGYIIKNIDELKDTFVNSCPLRFISNWKLDKTYVYQGEKAIFE